MSTLGLDTDRVLSFLKAVDWGYKDVPYHNKLHGADVAQTVYCILKSGSLIETLHDWQRMAAIVAGLVHDLGHPGVTNR